MGDTMDSIMKFNKNETTKIHVVKLSDGTVTTLDTGKWIMVFHYGNGYMKDADTIVF